MKTRIKLLTTLLCFVSINVFAQSTDAIVNSHIEAVGGKANWEKVKSIRIENTLKAEGADIQITIVQVDKKAMRQDFSVMGMNGYSIVNNTEGWNYMPWQGQTKAEAMTADDVKNSQNDLYIQDEKVNFDPEKWLRRR